MQPFNVEKAVEGIREPFSSVDLAHIDGYVLRCSLDKGASPWHRHVDHDQLFLCHSGRLGVETHEKMVELLPGEGVVVPKGVEHRTSSVEGAVALVIERRETRSRGE